jgi:hypothetical protein
VEIAQITDPAIRSAIVAQVGGEPEATAFFQAFEFNLDSPDIEIREESLMHKFEALGLREAGLMRLKDRLRRWIRKNESILFTEIQGASLWQELAPLPQECPIPDDFVIPSMAFHEKLINALDGTATCVVLSGPPGIGKTSYLSNLYQELRGKDGFAVRHHYHLPLGDGTPFRYSHEKVANSLMAEMKIIAAKRKLQMPVRNPETEELREWLLVIGQQLKARNEKLVVILDGLDHVWNDSGSIEELDRLFQIITPVPDGTALLIGTQPVDDTRLPRRLSNIAPRENWLHLPALERAAVKEWTKLHAEDLGITEQSRDHWVSTLASALWRKSEGYPLHLRYILASLRETKDHITEHDIDALPDVPHADITTYYGFLWRELSDTSRQVLALLATCDFPWSRLAIAECLDPLRVNQTIGSSIRQVTHLTVDQPLGLSFVHSSVRAYVLDHPDYSNYAPRIRAMSLQWLRKSAPAVYRWSYEWLLAADTGDSTELLTGPNRNWLIDGMARGYPISSAERILQRAARCALMGDDFGRFMRLALLGDYLTNAAQFREEIVERLTSTQLALSEDPLLLKRMEGSLKFLTCLELEALAVESRRQTRSDLVRLALAELNLRISQEDEQQAGADSRTRVQALVRVAAFASTKGPGAAKAFIEQFDPGTAAELWTHYMRSLRRFRQIETLRALCSETTGIINDRSVATAVLTAREEQCDFDPQYPTGTDIGDPFVVIFWFLKGRIDNSIRQVNMPKPWVFDLKWRNYHGPYDDVIEYLWRMFFVFTANALIGREEESAKVLQSLDNESWGVKFLALTESVARKFATHIGSRSPAPYGWIIQELSDIKIPNHDLDAAGNAFSTAARHAVFRIAIDALILQGSPESLRITPVDVRRTRESPFFWIDPWLDSLLATPRAWCTEEGLTAILEEVQLVLDSSIDTFDSRAQTCVAAAELAAAHGSKQHGANWLRKAWENLLAYGFHKDFLLDQCIEAVDHLFKIERKSEAESLLKRLAAPVAHVADFTDGDETNHFPAELGKLLADHDPSAFARYYEWLCGRGDYWEAETIFAKLIRTVDLNNPYAAAVGATAIDARSLQALATRSSDGDLASGTCLKKLAFFHVRPKEQHRETSEQSAELTRLPPGEFPPARFTDYLTAVKKMGRYRDDEAVDLWAKFWIGKGDDDSILAALDEYDESGTGFFTDGRLRFELALSVRGREAAYRTLVSGYEKRLCWNRYQTADHEYVLYMWKKVRELYSQNWRDFLKNTLINDAPRYGARVITVQNYVSRLVEFLTVIEQPDVAVGVAEAAIESVTEFVPLKIREPEWLTNSWVQPA